MILVAIALIAVAIATLLIFFTKKTRETEVHKTRLEENNIETNKEIFETKRLAVFEEYEEFIKRVVVRHSRILRKKMKQHLRTDEYGKEIGFEKAYEEVVYFLTHVLEIEPGYREIRQRVIKQNFEKSLGARNLEDYDLSQLDIELKKELNEKLIALVLFLATEGEHQTELDEANKIEALSGTEFEIYVEYQLKSLGWSVYRKGGTGDQGVDLIAQQNGKTVAIQCKRRAGPVGNHAVQQIEAGRQFEDADFAVVVSNNRYTPASQKLASKLNVILLHHTELTLLSEYVKQA